MVSDDYANGCGGIDDPFDDENACICACFGRSNDKFISYGYKPRFTRDATCIF